MLPCSSFSLNNKPSHLGCRALGHKITANQRMHSDFVVHWSARPFPRITLVPCAVLCTPALWTPHCTAAAEIEEPTISDELDEQMLSHALLPLCDSDTASDISCGCVHCWCPAVDTALPQHLCPAPLIPQPLHCPKRNALPLTCNIPNPPPPPSGMPPLQSVVVCAVPCGTRPPSGRRWRSMWTS